MEQNTRYAAAPLTLGRNGRTPKTLRNRLASAPMERNYGTTDGRITEQYIDYLVTRAKAGLGMVTTEATYVRADGKGRTHQLGLHSDSMIPGLRKLTDALHKEGALAAVELNHGGRTAQAAVSGFKNVAPSPVPCEVAGGEVPHELTSEECDGLVEAYAQAARRAVLAGFDVINLHGAHGYLIHQFMSPVSNHRKDRFGAPEYFMNRVIDAVRAAVPDTIVGMRVSVLEGPANGISAEEQVAIMAKAHLDKLDFLDISAGSYEAGEWIVQSGEWKPGVLAGYAKAYRQFGIPLGMAGRLNSPDIIEEVLAAGTCDFVSLARAVHADPAFVGGVLHGGRYRPCIACNVCIDNLGLGQVTCTVNPAVGRSRIPVPTPAVREGTRVAVVGAGPAGLTAARELAEAGAKVTVFDDGVRPGGQFALAERMKSTPDFHRFMEWSAAENARLGIDLELGSRVDTARLDAFVRETAADAVVLATGGLRPAAGFPAVGSADVLDIRDWLAGHPEVLAEPMEGAVMPEAVTIWGADSVAMSVADTLADRGTAVLLLGPQEAIAPESGRRAKILAVPRLQANPRVRIRLDSVIEEYDGTRVRVSGPDCPPAGEWLDAPGPILVSRSVVPLDGSIAAGARDAELSLLAGVPVTLAGTVVDQAPAIASNAVKSGYDAAQRIAVLLSPDSLGTTKPSLDGALQ
ncbi:MULTISPECIES: FAD-dependent oxidoreductase [unclassified Arthrobacter]|uniref:FAD-dependent oxidoreductase n=1 Tax=unclassified Arthrobacter TaxID=235627 RepID=UPI001C85643F|nr:FAD-dependent oxidoreductase [Arthrobacter sp. MAHUQ-56]MBX7442948.1 NAD(P)/FAD-dependent oxidoreductase [Arthrobacter sp. MAHUQ-56]